MKDSYENVLISSKRRPCLIETDRCKEFLYSISQNFLKNININYFSMNASLGAVFAERFNLTIRNLLNGPIFGRSDANWIDILPKITKQNICKVHSFTKLTPIPPSSKRMEAIFSKTYLENERN